MVQVKYILVKCFSYSFCVCVWHKHFYQHKYKTVLKKYPHLTIYEKVSCPSSVIKEKSDLLSWFQSWIWVGWLRESRTSKRWKKCIYWKWQRLRLTVTWIGGIVFCTRRYDLWLFTGWHRVLLTSTVWRRVMRERCRQNWWHCASCECLGGRFDMRTLGFSDTGTFSFSMVGSTRWRRWLLIGMESTARQGWILTVQQHSWRSYVCSLILPTILSDFAIISSIPHTLLNYWTIFSIRHLYIKNSINYDVS